MHTYGMYVAASLHRLQLRKAQYHLGLGHEPTHRGVKGGGLSASQNSQTVYLSPYLPGVGFRRRGYLSTYLPGAQVCNMYVSLLRRYATACAMCVERMRFPSYPDMQKPCPYDVMGRK